MKIYVTSDPHFHHENIIKYCNRPFKNKKEMDDTIVKNWNETVNKDDDVYMIGDFCFKSNRHYWESQLNGNITYIRGNHDEKHFLFLTAAIAEYSGLNFLLIHRPPEHPKEIPDFVDIVLCGHVHEKWKFKMMDDIIMINCSVEQWDYKPVLIDTIIKEAENFLSEKEDEKGI